jgi:ubiquinone/menaquinone biosynthesis C-methylase UbiE
MLVKLDQDVLEMLVCPFCKGELIDWWENDCMFCADCHLTFPRIRIQTDKDKFENVYDFRLKYPSYAIPKSKQEWSNGQDAFEQYADNMKYSDNINEYLNEVYSVKEIYEKEFHLCGNVLDVGGEQGKLRFYLNPDVVQYVDIDPSPNVFQGIYQKENLNKVYYNLRYEMNFLLATAEHLPFKTGSFDWIHMRSTVDHFEDPFVALLEAQRVTKENGHILIGLAIIERLANPPAHDDHMFRFTHLQMRDLLEKSGWEVEKEHWQKAPWNFCLYISGKKC